MYPWVPFFLTRSSVPAEEKRQCKMMLPTPRFTLCSFGDICQSRFVQNVLPSASLKHKTSWLEKQQHNMMLRPPCFTLQYVWCPFGDMCCFWDKQNHYAQKCPTLVSSDHGHYRSFGLWQFPWWTVLVRSSLLWGNIPFLATSRWCLLTIAFTFFRGTSNVFRNPFISLSWSIRLDTAIQYMLWKLFAN